MPISFLLLNRERFTTTAHRSLIEQHFIGEQDVRGDGTSEEEEPVWAFNPASAVSVELDNGAAHHRDMGARVTVLFSVPFEKIQPVISRRLRPCCGSRTSRLSDSTRPTARSTAQLAPRRPKTRALTFLVAWPKLYSIWLSRMATT